MDHSQLHFEFLSFPRLVIAISRSHNWVASAASPDLSLGFSVVTPPCIVFSAAVFGRLGLLGALHCHSRRTGVVTIHNVEYLSFTHIPHAVWRPGGEDGSVSKSSCSTSIQT